MRKKEKRRREGKVTRKNCSRETFSWRWEPTSKMEGKKKHGVTEEVWGKGTLTVGKKHGGSEGVAARKGAGENRS